MALLNPLVQRTTRVPSPGTFGENPLLRTEQAEVVGEQPLVAPFPERQPLGALPPRVQPRVTPTPPPPEEALRPPGAPPEVEVTPPPPEEVVEVAPMPTDPAAFGTATQQAVQQGDPNTLLNTMFQNAQDFFAGFDWGTIGQQSQDYLQQLLTGQTEATRALQAREATAMAQGVKNLMNNISSSAANAGITGQALADFYNTGLNQVGQMMGKFAMDNIIRMAETQAQGFDGLMRMFKLSDEQARNWMSTYRDWQDFTIGNDQWNKAFGWNALKYITEAAATDPTAGELLGRLYSGLEQGLSLSEILSETDMNYLSNTVRDSQSLTDVAGEVKYIQDELGFQALVTQATDADGNLIFKSDGTPVWEVSIATEMVDGQLRMIPYGGAGEGEGGTTTTPTPPGTPSVNTPEEIMTALSDINTAEWNRMTPDQQANVNNFLLTSFDNLDNAQLRLLAQGTPEEDRATIIEEYGDAPPTLQGDINAPQESRVWVSTPDGEPGYIDGGWVGMGPEYGSPGRHYTVYNMNNEVVGYLYTPDMKGGTVRHWRKDTKGTDWEGAFQMPEI